MVLDAKDAMGTHVELQLAIGLLQTASEPSNLLDDQAEE